jgi:hypothetical protein
MIHYIQVWYDVYPSSLYNIKIKSRQQCWKSSNHLTAAASEILLYLIFILETAVANLLKFNRPKCKELFDCKSWHMTEIYKAVLYTWQEKGFGQGLSPSV